MEQSINGAPLPRRKSMADTIAEEHDVDIDGMTNNELFDKMEHLLRTKIKQNDKMAQFQLGQLYFEQKMYKEAFVQFERIKEQDYQAQYQLGVMFYDGLAVDEDPVRGLEYMMSVANANNPQAKSLTHYAQYNIGRAYFEGCGVFQNDSEAEKWWLLAADDGNPRASVRAQTALGMFYARPETYDIKKAFFWHSEACGNGSLESQAAMGVMYFHGLGTKRDATSAFQCWKEASERGNVYAMGNLVAYYYERKLFNKAAQLAAHVSQIENPDEISSITNCLPFYISRGVALACFYYGRCLQFGEGVLRNVDKAKEYYSRSYQFDPTTTAMLQEKVQHGEI